jgi:hypothetical protein
VARGVRQHARIAVELHVDASGGCHALDGAFFAAWQEHAIARLKTGDFAYFVLGLALIIILSLGTRRFRFVVFLMIF